MKKNNSHMHFLTKDHVPDNYFKTRVPGLTEWYLDRYTTMGIAYLQKPFTESKHLPQMIKLYKMKLKEQVKYYIEEMDKAEIQSAIVLMMDMNESSFGDKSEWSYPYQVIAMLEIAEQYPGRFYVFPMVDPRREGISGLINYLTYYRQDYIKGIKLYPNLGYSPDPYDFYNSPKTNENLMEIYDRLNQRKLCVISHCSKGGAYSDKTMRSEEERHWLSHPLRYETPASRFPRIKFCLAHFGGDLHEPTKDDLEDFALKIDHSLNTYSAHIIRMMQDIPNIWTDIAYNDKLIKEDTAQRWVENFWALPDHVYKRIMAGTDWLMTSHWKTEKEYYDTAEANLKKYMPSWRYGVGNDIMVDLFRRNFYEFLGIEEN